MSVCIRFLFVIMSCCIFLFFFFNDPATTEIYTYCNTLPLHDALPISRNAVEGNVGAGPWRPRRGYMKESFNDIVEQAMRIPGRAHMRPVIEKELLHYDILFALSQAKMLDSLTFQGGTSLRLRSEEPTSELQSLMRKSYAVFCLN